MNYQFAALSDIRADVQEHLARAHEKVLLTLFDGQFILLRSLDLSRTSIFLGYFVTADVFANDVDKYLTVARTQPISIEHGSWFIELSPLTVYQEKPKLLSALREALMNGDLSDDVDGLGLGATFLVKEAREAGLNS